MPQIDWKVACFGGSNLSEDDASLQAKDRLEELKRKLTGQSDANHYPYAERPLREEVKEEYHQEEKLEAVVTRNSYGSLILNTAQVMFIDLDFPSGESLWGQLMRWLRRAPYPETEIRERLTLQVAQERNLGVRLYRTANGYRCLVTSALYEPASDETKNLLERFGCDPLYVKLCRMQECFRARLTPKHWRCGAPCPPFRFPWKNRDEEQKFRKWEQDYEQQSAAFATCQFIENLGTKKIIPEAERIVKIHDAFVCKPGELA